MLELHRHGEFSSFDGFGKALDLARLAKEKGITALGLSDHGNMNGTVEHWKACKAEGIKPIIGVEAYFQPKFNKKDPKRDSFHLCLFAKNLQGYKNLNKIMTISNAEQKYYKPIADFDLLEKYSEGIICTSGCIASFISQLIIKGNKAILKKAVEKFIDLYGDDFYIEVQPYKLDEQKNEEKNLQEKVNIELIKIAKKYDLKIVFTSDSHYGSEYDYDTYCKMHEMKGSSGFNETYRERYMPNEDDLVKRFVKMHKNDFKNPEAIARKALKDMNGIIEKVDGEILDKLELKLPKVSNDSAKKLKQHIVKGLKERGKHTKKYLKVCKMEYEVIVHHGFEDYFLIVEDYVRWAKNRGIKVGPGRGSVCNSAIAYALNITEVDPVYFDIDFRRFMRMDKSKMPDIDLDFETDRRQEVIEYIIDKYPGKSAQICSYGLYKVDNLLNELFKVCGVDELDEKKDIKDYVGKHVKDDEFRYDDISHTAVCKTYNKAYDDIIRHFSKMYKKVRYIGTHAAGVAIVGGDLLDYTSVELRGNKKDGYMKTTAYNLNNLDEINVIKFDMLGLRTLSITKELEEMTNECFSYEWLEDVEMYKYFADGKTDGIFQFEKPTAKKILQNMEADSINDVIAASALNRPGPLSLKMPEHYAHGKLEGEFGNEPWSDYTDKTYGTIVYQEQIQAICREIGGLSFSDADRVVKFMKSVNMTEAQIKQRENEITDLRDRFIIGCKKNKNMSNQEAEELFEKITVYSFNQGHSTGYALISVQQMWFKVKYPELFWYTTLKYANTESDLYRLEIEAVREGNVILLPHVNYSTRYSIVQIEGENALAKGLSDIKNVGVKAAKSIEDERVKGGPFKSRDDFLERIPKQQVNKRVIDSLDEAGALLFDKKVYFTRVEKYNSALYTRGLNRG